MDDVSIPFYIL